MTPDEAFLQDIGDNPEDDTPRLIYADWLDDHDQPERAEFIRLQCQLASRNREDAENQRLVKRERELLQRHGQEWLGGLIDMGVNLVTGPGAYTGWWRFHDCAEFERGFVEKVTLPYTDFVLRAETLFAAAPTIRSIRLVRIDGRLPETLDDVTLLADSSELSRLRTLDLNRLFIGDDRVAIIIDSSHLYGLKRLELALSSVNGRQTVEAVAVNRSLAGLRELNLSSLSIGSRGVLALVTASHLANLASLDLSRNRITGECAARLALAVHLTNLRSLDLEYNQVDDDGARALADSPHLKHLTRLNLAHNPIGEAGKAALRERFGPAVLL